MPKVSVIIPVYNAEQYIVRCLESLRNQTLKGIEVILVDDHGRDGAIVKAKEMIASEAFREASKLNDLTFVFKQTEKNSGPGIARNEGMRVAKGDYITFLDADDWVEPMMYEVLYENALKYDADLSGCNAVLDYPANASSIDRETHEQYVESQETQKMTNPKVDNGKLTIDKKKYILNRFVSNFTTYLFRREWLQDNGLVFPPEKSGEDSCFMGSCYLMARRIALVDETMYHYVIHQDSISHGKHIWRGGWKRRAFGALIQFAKDKGLWQTYRWQLRWIYFKKALLVPIIEWMH